MNNEVVFSELSRDYLQKLVESGKRIDGRRFDEYRELKIEKNVIKRAEGSAKVNLGNTSVVVGVKLDLGAPYPDSPNMGVLTTNAELVPMASPTFESGPPNENSIELARVVDRGIRESECVNFEKLCVVAKEKVWIVFVDIHVLDYDGNLFDASSYGAVVALANTIVPAKKFNIGEDYKLPMEHFPISSTAVKIGNSLLIDPCLEEEEVADARLTVTTDENGNIRAIQKGLVGAFTYEEVVKVVASSQEIGKKIRDLLK